MDDSASLLSVYVPDFEYVMLDLTQYSDAEIKGAVLSRVVMLLFKHSSDPDIIEKLPAIFSLMQGIVESEDGLRYLEAILRYVFSTVDLSVDEIKGMVETSISPEKGDEIMTLAERLKNEGYHKGVQDTIREGYIKTINLGLNLKFPNQYHTFMSFINQIRDNQKLEKIADAFLTVKYPAELKKMMEQ